MSEQVELTNPVDLSVGGMSGHISVVSFIFRCS